MKLSDVSPLAGIVTGEGLMGKLTSLGGLGALASSFRDDEEEKRKKQAAGEPMKKGGKVSSASSRADGCAVKGKTKGRII